jgi:hypothetical protein
MAPNAGRLDDGGRVGITAFPQRFDQAVDEPAVGVLVLAERAAGRQ